MTADVPAGGPHDPRARDPALDRRARRRAAQGGRHVRHHAEPRRAARRRRRRDRDGHGHGAAGARGSARTAGARWRLIPVARLAAAIGELAGHEVELERPKDADARRLRDERRAADGGGRAAPAARARAGARRPGRGAPCGRARRGRRAGVRQPLARATRGTSTSSAEVDEDFGGGWVGRAGARPGRDGLREPDGADRRLGRHGTAPTATASRASSSSPATTSSASTTTTTPARRWSASASRSRRSGAASRCPRTATTASTSRSSRRRTATPSPRCCAGSRRRWSASASTSTPGRCQSELEQRLAPLLPRLDTYEKDGATLGA